MEDVIGVFLLFRFGYCIFLLCVNPKVSAFADTAQAWIPGSSSFGYL